METRKTPTTICNPCGQTVRVKKDGALYKHPANGQPCDGVPALILKPVSDPAPTVEVMDDAPQKGPWFGAMYEGRCSVSECEILEGDRIRADGEGGYECEACGDDYGHGDEQDPEQPLVDGWMTDPTPVAAMYSEPTEEAVTNAMPFPTADEFMDPAEPEPQLNVSGQPKARRDWQGRYIVVDPDLGDFRRTKGERKPKGITRATTFNKAAQDTKSLNDWRCRNVVMGAVLRPDVLRRAHQLRHETDRDELNRIVEELTTAAGAKVSADEGTYLHGFCDEVDAGLKTWRDAPPMYRGDIERYVQALVENDLEPVPGLIERTTMIREYGGVVGTFDRIFYHRPSGQYLIGDLKTGKTMKYAMDETECQIWTYAHGVNQNGIYDWHTDTWGPVGDPMTRGPHPDGTPIKVSETVGVIVHMPVQGPEAGTVSVLKADLVAGQAHAELCHKNRSRPKSKPVLFDGTELLPERPVRAQEPTWDERFAGVTSPAAAGVLWEMARAAGVTDGELHRLTRIAQQALTDRA